MALVARRGRRGDRPRHRAATGSTRPSRRSASARQLGADVLVTIGGASVGDHDLVQKALAAEGMALSFWKIAMRPGKPLMHGRLGRACRCSACPATRSRPMSARSCSWCRCSAGSPAAPISGPTTESAVLGCDLPANDERADYMRATLARRPRRRAGRDALPAQDSPRCWRRSRRPIAWWSASRYAPAAAAGARCRHPEAYGVLANRSTSSREIKRLRNTYRTDSVCS